jgi:hypothetical protein
VYISWPSLLWSLPLSDSVKKEAWEERPSIRTRILLLVRATGQYSLGDYRRHIRPHLHSIAEQLSAALIAVLPRVALNSCLVFYYSTIRRKDELSPLSMLIESPFYQRKRRAKENRELHVP